MTGVVLKGMTWSHPRGYDPMIACSTLWKDQTGVTVEWHKRSLQDFETYPVEELARAYDLIVIDHPHVGQITEEKCLLPLQVPRHHAEQNNLRTSSVGKSYPSYYWKGQQWALPIDAAAQVQAYRPDKLSSPAVTWNEVLELARHHQVALPLRPPHSLMTLYTLYNNVSDTSADDGNGELFNIQTGALVFEMMQEIAELIDSKCLEMDPIEVLEVMAQNDPSITCSPLIYGYVSYSVDGFRPGMVKFGNIARCGNNGLGGSALGGTGIAVSAFSRKPDQAMDFAYWVAGGDVQKTIYAQSGGQPGHSVAWDDDSVNASTSNFYRDTRLTLEHSWVRPRHHGYMAFQQLASERINQGLIDKQSAHSVIAEINDLFRRSIRA